ncbi:Thiamin-phosphate pyrophosphorylase [Minicystis rosea]|nr:Thiamin-phosphate pyrophosphorylase [Minicystis rosea]
MFSRLRTPFLCLILSAFTVAPACGGTGSEGGSTGASSSGSGGTGGDDMMPIDLDCIGPASTICYSLAGCTKKIIDGSFRDVEACKARLQQLCTRALRAPETSFSTEIMNACADDFNGASCYDVMEHLPPSWCRPGGGGLADGAPCGNDWSCQSGYCRITGACGVCAARATEGGSCVVSEDCDYGLTCVPSGTCTFFRHSGETCDDDAPCGMNLVCNRPDVGQPGQCMVIAWTPQCLPHAPGEDGCGAYQGMWCNPATNKCEEVAYADFGQSCGERPQGFLACDRGVCSGPAGAQTCGAPAADGAPCSTDSSLAPCDLGARCLDGVCRAPDANACP